MILASRNNLSVTVSMALNLVGISDLFCFGTGPPDIVFFSFFHRWFHVACWNALPLVPYTLRLFHVCLDRCIMYVSCCLLELESYVLLVTFSVVLRVEITRFSVVFPVVCTLRPC